MRVVEKLKESEKDLKVKKAFDYYLSIYERVKNSDAWDKSLSAVDFRFVVNYFSWVFSRFSEIPYEITKDEIEAFKVCKKVILALAKERKYNPEDYTERTMEKALSFVYSKNKKLEKIGTQRLKRFFSVLSRKKSPKRSV